MNDLQKINDAVSNWLGNLDFKPTKNLFNVNDALDGFKFEPFEDTEDVCLSDVVNDIVNHLENTSYSIDIGDYNYKEYEYLLKDSTFKSVADKIDALGLDKKSTFDKYVFLLQTIVDNTLILDKIKFTEYLVDSFEDLVSDLEEQGFNI